jgi:hypothetical protein
MATIELTAEEVTESMTGFDELAVAHHFGEKDFQDLPGSMALRALVFVHERRNLDGPETDRDAYQKAMALTIKEAGAYFAEAEEEPMPDEPVTVVGKGDEPDA